MESYESFKNQGEIMEYELGDLVKVLAEKIVDELSVECVDGTYEIESNKFTLTFTIEDDRFEIRSIDVHGNVGAGSEIIAAVHDYADDNNFKVIASNVTDTAIGFWEKMGYQEGSEEGEFFRAA